jgi:hypothetical protein
VGLINCQIVEQASSLWTGRMPYILYLIATSYLLQIRLLC